MRYAARHEYAQTAIDVIARRCRLSFLNAQSALSALPRVVDIMAEELNWDAKRKDNELVRATEFLASMGLPPYAAEAFLKSEEVRPKSLLEKAGAVFGFGSASQPRKLALPEMMYSRAQFEAGDLDRLRAAFGSKAKDVAPPKDVSGAPAGATYHRVEKGELFDLVKGLPGFETIKTKDFNYVLDEVGFAKQRDVDFEEFVEVCFASSRIHSVA